jgi:hypothetical protein
MRATSFVITAALVLCSSSVLLLPIALGLWLVHLLSAHTALAGASILAAGYALAVAFYAHLAPPPLGSNHERSVR